jgi:hypothetical protein
MRRGLAFARNLIVLLGLMCSTEVMAQSVNFRIGFKGHVDCDQPFQVRNVPISADGTGVLNPDGSASASLTQTAFVLSTTIQFEGRLGAPPRSAPGGTSQVRVAGKNALRLIWSLPNNQMIVDIAVRGQSCSASLNIQLKPGKTQYTLFDGSVHHYCGRPRVEQTSCEVR